MWCPVQVAALSRQLPVSCSDPRELTFTLFCLKTRQSVCCLSESKVSGIWLIIYMTFRKSGSDLLSSFCPLWLFLSFSPRPHSDCQRRIYHIKSTNYIQDEKNLYFIYYFISLPLLLAHPRQHLYFIALMSSQEKPEILPEFLSLLARLTANSAKYTRKIGLDCETGDELIGYWPLARLLMLTLVFRAGWHVVTRASCLISSRRMDLITE